MTKPKFRFNLNHIAGIVICIIILIFALLFRIKVINKPATININSTSTLMDIINIAELSTAEFQYKGIAEVYKDEKKSKIRCRICYNSIVKAGIDMDEVKLNVDNDNKVVTATLPDIDIKVTIIDKESSLAYLPSNAEMGIKEAREYCKEDVLNEAKNSKELFATAEKNLKLSIEGLLYPILKAENYSLVWK